MNVIQTYVIWKFAKNIDGTKQFLVDYMGQFRHGFLASELHDGGSYRHVANQSASRCTSQGKALKVWTGWGARSAGPGLSP